MELTLEDILLILGSNHIKFKGGGYCDLLHFDLKRKRISNGKIVIMDKGKVIPQTLKLNGIQFELTEDMVITNAKENNPYEKLEELYQDYKYSVPNMVDKYARCNFKGVDGNELTLKQIRDNLPRQKARYKLEIYVMFTKFPWKNEKHYYWQGKDPDLILYKEWSE